MRLRVMVIMLILQYKKRLRLQYKDLIKDFISKNIRRMLLFSRT
jgi:hypothetical protein